MISKNGTCGFPQRPDSPAVADDVHIGAAQMGMDEETVRSGIEEPGSIPSSLPREAEASRGR